MSIDYERQRALSIPTYDVSVVGCGGTGTWVAILSAMSGSNQIKLFDSDALELHNLNRLPYSPEDVAKEKTTLLSELIHKIRPECTVLTFHNVEADSLTLLEGVIYDCTDRREAQNMLQEYCEKHSPPLIYRRVGYDGDHLTVMSQGSPVDKDAQDGYQIVPSWVVPSVLSATLGVYSVLRMNNKKSFVGDINNLYNLSDNSQVGDSPREETEEIRIGE